jgi:uncharacterized protein YrrD
MLIKAKSLKGYKFNGLDGDIGSVHEFFFDDKFWTIRYLVANTGNWFTNRQVLISPYFIQSVDNMNKLVNTSLTKQKIYDSPEWESEKPVSRQYEETYINYYGTPIYWGGTGMWGAYPYLMRDQDKWKTSAAEKASWNPNLRSTQDVKGHDFQATDGEIGHVDDFIIDDDTWTIRYFVLETNKWFSSRKTLISTQWIDRISWDDKKVYVNVLRDTINHVPDYDEDRELTRDYENYLHKHYNREGYWFKNENVSAHSH